MPEKTPIECASVNYKNNSLNPCNSPFTKNYSFGDGLFGDIKVVDIALIKEIANKNKLNEIANLYFENIIVSSSKTHLIKVTPNIIDRTGFLKNETSKQLKNSNYNVSISKHLDAESPYTKDPLLVISKIKYSINMPYLSEINMDTIEYKLRLYPSWEKSNIQYDNVKLSTFFPTPTQPNININNNIIINKAVLSNLTPNHKVIDKNISMELISTSPGRYKLTIKNKTKKHINIKSYSVYYDDKISSVNDVNYSLPPCFV